MNPKITEEHAAHITELVPIQFEFNNPEAVTVHVAGTFNAWSERASPLTRGYGGRWARAMALEPGDYEYCLVVDGRWILDPMNQVSVHNSYGGRNSVLTVPESKQASHLIDAEHEPLQLAKKNGQVGALNTDGIGDGQTRAQRRTQ
ncbi:MAG TPA: glycogen-binding domain-containing protein [Verrucomicrobiae bacterium]|nr:glycogen-binding domain-containing protein [Verrucomicrobiae bacterium]